LIVLGEAVIARENGVDNIEGIDADEARTEYGGTNDEDSSGNISYISIRHGGAALAPGDEINGFTLGGVGSGTTIDYVEVFANFDDGIEWFGGTVRIDHAAVSYCGDDAFDYDFGWRGGGQFWFSLQDASVSTGRAGEHDGASPDGQAPFSNPTIVNATYIGIGADATATGGESAEGFAFGVYFRDNAGGTYANSIFTDFNDAAIVIEDRTDQDETDSYGRFLAGDLQLTNNYFFGFGRGDELGEVVLVIDQSGNVNTDNTASLAATLATANNVISDPKLNYAINRDTIDPRPNVFGAAATAGIDNAVTGFEATDYIGAFAPGNGNDNMAWLAGWTALSESEAVLDVVSGVGSVERNGIVLDAPVPNPAFDFTSVNFSLTTAGQVNITVIDMLGRSMGTFSSSFQSGDQTQTVDVRNLPNGNYVIVVESAGSRLAQKMVVRR
jgi:hypothetical protein